MIASTVITRILRANCSSQSAVRTIFTQRSPVYLQFTPVLCAEPLKKKKRLDPAIIKAREDRRKRKIEKQIRRLEKNQRQLKPIDEVEVPLEILDSKGQRQRKVTLSEEKMEEIALMKKEWSRYMYKLRINDAQMIDRIAYSQQRALQELRFESEELYQAAVQRDDNLLPFSFQGPVETPPIENYDSPDGEYLDISKKWV